MSKLLYIFLITRLAFAAGPAGIESGLRLWLDASDNASMFTDAACTPGNEVSTHGDDVRCWKDKSAQGFEAKNIIGTPKWVDDGGLDAIEFTSDRMDIEGSTGGAVFDDGVNVSETEVFFVARTRTISNGWAFGYQYGGKRFGTHFPWSNSFVYFDVGTCCGASRISAPWGGSESFLHTWNFISDDGAPNYQAIYRDGALVASDAVADSITWGNSDFQIGSYGTQYQQINAAEFIIYDRRLTPTERNQVKNYLLNKWKKPVAASDGWTSGTTKTITTPSGTDRMLVVVAGYEDNIENPITSVTYGGQAMTQASQISTGTSFYAGSSIWILNDSGISSAANSTIVATHASGATSHTDITSAVYTGIDQVSPIYSTAIIDDGQSGLPDLETMLDVTKDGITIVAGQCGNTGTFSTNLTTVVSHSGNGTSQTVGVQLESNDQNDRTIAINHTNNVRMVLAGVHLRSSTLAEVVNLSSIATSDQSIGLAWDKRDSVPNYRIAYQEGASAPGNCELGTQIDAGSVSNYQITGLSSNTQYSFRVCANSGSSYTNGLTSSATTELLPPDPPSELLGVNLSINGPDSVTYEWVSGGGGTTGFRLAYKLGAVSPASCLVDNQVDLGNTTSYTLTGLTSLTDYSYRICAYNGSPIYTTGLTGTFTTPGIATSSSEVHIAGVWQTGPSRSDFGSAQNRLFVLAIGFEGGSDIASISYGGQAMTKVINRDQGGARTEIWALNESQITALTNPKTANITYSGGAPTGTIYSSVVLGNVDQATYENDTNTAGVNSTTDNLSINTIIGGLSLVGSTTRRNSAVGSWTGAGWETGIIESNTRLGFATTFKESSVSGSDNVDINFTGGAINMSMAGAHFKLVDATNPANLTLDSKSDVVLNLSWTSGLGSTRGFRIAHQAGVSAPADCSAGIDISNVTSRSITGLSASTEYGIRVCPYNVQGTLSSGITLQATTGDLPLAAPTEISSLNSNTVSSSEISLNWISGGGTTESFEIAYQVGPTAPANCSSGTIINTTSTAKAITALSDNTTYSFRVCSKNADGVLSAGLTITDSTDPAGIDPSVTLAGGWQAGLSRTMDAGSNRMLVFVVSSEDNVDADITAVTYGGESLTHAQTAQDSFGGTNYNRVEIWYLLEADIQAAANSTFNVTFSTGNLNLRYYAHTVLSEVDQVNPINDSSNKNFFNGVSPMADTLSSINGNISIAAATTSNNGTFSVNNGWSFGSEQNGNGSSLGTGYYVSSATTTENPSSSHTNAGRSAMASININSALPQANELTSLTATSINSSTIRLDWISGGGTTSGFRLAHQEGGTAPANCFSGTQANLGNVLTKQVSSLSASTTYSFRVCAYNAAGDYSTGQIVSITTPNPDTNWTGSVNTDWFNAGNWDNGVPNSTISCTIPNVANDPVINGSIGSGACKNLTIMAPVIIDGSSSANSLSGFGQISLSGAASISGTNSDFIISDGNSDTQAFSSTTNIPSLKIEKSSGGILSLTSDISANNLDLSSANFSLSINNGVDFDISNSFSIPANSTIDVKQGGRLRVDSGETISVTGGVLKTSGVIDTSLADNPGYNTNQAHIGVNGGGSFSIQASSGVLDFQGVNINRLNSSGIQVTGSASVSKFDGVHLTNSQASAAGQAILFNSTGSFVSTANYFGYDLEGTQYIDNASHQIFNAPSCGSSNHTLTLLEWYGNFKNGGGEVRVTDNEPSCDIVMDLSASPISLASFSIRSYSDSIVLEWKTTAEIMHKGFNVYRSQNPENGYVKINDELILNSIFSVSYSGEYRYVDSGVQANTDYYYILEDVSVSNVSDEHGPYQAALDPLLGPAPAFNDNINQYSGDNTFENSNPSELNNYLTNIAPGVNLYQKPDGSIRLHIKVDKATISDSSWNASYKDVSIPSFVNLSDAGKPSLSFSEILVPAQAPLSNINLSISSEDFEDSTALISPAPDYTVVAGVLTPNFNPDNSVYTSSNFYPSDSFISVDSNSININGVEYIRIKLNALLFKGDTNTLRSLDEMYVDVDFDQAQSSSEITSSSISTVVPERNGARIFFTKSGHYKVSFDDLFAAGVESLFEGKAYDDLELIYKNKSIPVYIIKSNDEFFGEGDSIVFKVEFDQSPYSSLDSVLLGINETDNNLRYIPVYDTYEGLDSGISYTKETLYSEDNPSLFINNRSIGAGSDHYFWSRIYLGSSDTSNPSAARFCRSVDLRGINSDQIQIDLKAAPFANLSIADSTLIDVYFSSSPLNIVQAAFSGQKLSSQSVDYQFDFNPASDEELCFSVSEFNSKAGEFYIFDIENFKISYSSDQTGSTGVKGLEFATKYSLPVDSSKGEFIVVQDEKEGDSYIYNNYTLVGDSISFTTQGNVGLDSEFSVVYLSELNNSSQISWFGHDASIFDEVATSDILIITDRELSSKMQELVAHKESLGHKVSLVEQQQVYDYFSYGIKSPYAFKSLFTELNSVSSKKLNYILFALDSTVDPKNIESNNVVISRTPAYLNESIYHDYASLNWFIKEKSSSFDFSIGQLPINSLQDAQNIIDKIITYETSQLSVHTNEISFLYTDDSISNFEARSLAYSSKATLFQKSFTNLSNSAADKFEQELSDKFLVNYMGHGSEYELGSTHLDKTDVSNLTNSQKYPLLLALNCLSNFNASSDPEDLGIGESLLLKENAGAIGVIGANTLLSPMDQSLFANYFYEELNRLSKTTNTELGLGDILKNTHKRLEQAGLSNNQTQSIMLLGDPSLRLPASIYQKKPQTKVFSGPSAGGCSMSNSDMPWQDGVINLIATLILFIASRRVSVKSLLRNK